MLHPADLAWPEEEVVGAEAIHRILRGWLAALGHDAYEPAPSASPAAEADGSA